MPSRSAPHRAGAAHPRTTSVQHLKENLEASPISLAQDEVHRCGRRVTARLEDVLDAWAFAADHAELALDAWAASPSDRRAEAYVVYRAALDREESAAAMLAAASS